MKLYSPTTLLTVSATTHIRTLLYIDYNIEDHTIHRTVLQVMLLMYSPRLLARDTDRGSVI